MDWGLAVTLKRRFGYPEPLPARDEASRPEAPAAGGSEDLAGSCGAGERPAAGARRRRAAQRSQAEAGWKSPNDAPVGSATTAMRPTPPMSQGSRYTAPPSALTLAAVASTSAVPT